MQKKFIFSLSVFSVLVCSLIARAESNGCSEYSKASPDATCVVMRFQGTRGVWLPLERSEILRKEHLEYPELKIQIEKLSLALLKSEQASESYQKASLERKAIADIFEEKFNAALIREERLANKLDAWYRRPILWFSAGVVASVISAVAINLSIH